MTKRSFEQFIVDEDINVTSEWVRQPTGLEIYVRKSIMVPGGFELANLRLARTKQKKGIFSTFLDEWEDRFPLMLECITNPYLHAYMVRRPDWVFGICADTGESLMTWNANNAYNMLWRQKVSNHYDKAHQEGIQRIMAGWESKKSHI